MRLFASNAGAAVPGLTRRAASGSINIGVTPETFTTTFDAMLSGSQPAQGDKQSAQYDVQLAGGSTASYSANAATLAMSDPSGAINVTAKVTVDGKSTAVDDVTIFEPLGAFTSGTVAYTCTGDSMTVTNQAGVSLNATRTA